MEVRAGKTLLWPFVPHSGPVMVKGLTETGGVALYDMVKDEFFCVTEIEYSQCTKITELDEMLRVTNPSAWERELEMWKRAYRRCAIGPVPQCDAEARDEA